MTIICNEKKFDFNEGESIYEVLKDEILNSKTEIITCNFNNQIKSLNYKPKTGGIVQLLDYTNTEGKRVYVRGAMYIMSMAFHELYPEGLITINYQLSNSMFCTFENLEITDEVISNIKEKMCKIVREDIPIIKVKIQVK